MKEKYLEFKVADKYFAYPIHSIREIIEYPNIEPISGAPQQLLGVMNLRGNLVVVFDIASCLGEPTTTVTSKTCVIVTELFKEDSVYVVANKVDLVRQVIDISPQEMEEVPKLGGHFESPMVQGVAKLDERLLTILDVEQLLSHQHWSWVLDARTQQEANHE